MVEESSQQKSMKQIKIQAKKREEERSSEGDGEGAETHSPLETA